MDLTHRLRVPAPPDDVWAVLTDPERLSEVLPGSVVDSVAGDSFTGTMKVKLGSSLLTLAGSGRYAVQDDGDRRVVLATDGADRRGDAAVEAEHTVRLAAAPQSASETDVTVTTTMTWSGRPARLGDGVVADAVDRVLEHTASRIAARVAEGLPWAPPAGRHAAGAESVVDHPVELGADLGDVDAPPAARRAAPAGGASSSSRPTPSGPSPSPSPGPSPRPPTPAAPRTQQYVYRPFDNAAEPHIDAARTFVRVVVRRVVPYAGLGALAVFAAAAAVRRARR